MTETGVHRKGEMVIRMKIAPGTPLREALTKLEKGMYVWVSDNGMPELLIPLIDETRIEKFFYEYPYMENKRVSFAQGVAANDLLIYVS